MHLATGLAPQTVPQFQIRGNHMPGIHCTNPFLDPSIKMIEVKEP